MAALTACVSSAKYDRALGVMSKYEVDRMRAESERDVAIAGMNEQLAKEHGELASTKDAAAREKASLEATIAASKEELEQVRAQRALTEARMAEWKKLTSKLAGMISAGKIKVSIREGRMMVDLPSSVLFASGSADLQDAGKSPLTEVAAVLKEFPSRQFLVAGHTDTMPIVKTTLFKDNWDLSAARALTVTKFLIEQGIKPKSIAAAGYGEWDPVGNNKTDKGRQSNRRIEIILLPNIAELPKLPTMEEGGTP